MSISKTLSDTNSKVAGKTSKVTNNGDKKPGKLGGITDSVSGIQKNVAGTAVGLGNVVARASGAFGGKLGGKLANSLTGTTKAKYKPSPETRYMGGIQGFYSHFSSTKMDQVDKIDPFFTFECEFRFFPNLLGTMDVTKIKKTTTTHVEKTDLYEDGDITDTQTTTVSDSKSVKEREEKGGVKLSSTIGKLLQMVKMKNLQMDYMSQTGEDSQKDSKTTEEESSRSWEDCEQLYEEKIKTTKQVSHVVRPVETDLYVNLGIYIQKVTLPNINIEGGEEVTTMVGKFPVPGSIVVPDSTSFSMEVVNVEAPVIENVFYPWMRETTLPWWSYEDQPFTTATITFDFSEHSNTIYHFYGCRPTQVQLMQPDQSPTQNLTRNVTFTFDFMSIETKDVVIKKYRALVGHKQSGKKNGNSNTGLANAALFSATNTLKL